ncbi:MAG TPA: SMP-30/gluconolactonase/LRE family protein [Ktedonobacterales bacterium]|jgi:virginiamycin B lyase
MPRIVHGAPDGSDLALEIDDASAHQRTVFRHAPFALFVCALVSATLLVFTQAAFAIQAPRVLVATPQPTATKVTTQTNVRVLPAQIHIYPTADPRASLMQPVVDRAEYVWFGEMRANKLARLDPKTGSIREWDPPGGRYGLMMSALGPDGAIWFAEENGGHIGRFNPTTERFTTFPLASPDGHSPGPQHLQFDQHGQLWFTLNHSSQIARLNPATGAVRTWDVLPVEGECAPHPYSLAVTPEGIVWFGAALYGGVVGSLDPTSGAVTVHQLGKPTAQVTSMVSDKRGNVWFTELQFNRLGHINTHTGEVSEITLPEPVGATTGNYALDVTPDGAVWITSFDANAIIRYVPDSNAFTFYTLLIPNSVPFGMAAAPDGTIWFTSDGEPNDYIGHIFP